MPVRYSLSLIAALVLATPAWAQISIPVQDYFDYTSGQARTTTSFSTDDDVSADDKARIDALIAATGPNQTWDFTPITYPVQSTAEETYYSDTAGLPGADQFPNATIAEQTTGPDGMGGTATSYSYSSLNDGNYVSWGLYDPDTEEAIGYPDGVLRLDFPLEYQTTSSGQSSVSASYVPPGATITVKEEAEVVGWGTLVLPGGSYDALMIERVITTTTSFPGIPAQSVVNTLYEYVTREGATASAISDDAPQGGRIYVASYKENPAQTDTEAGPIAGGLSFSVAPNPVAASAHVEVVGLGREGVVAVYDLLGRRVAIEQLRPAGSRADVSLSTTGWAPGVYLVRVASEGRTVTQRITVLR